MRRKIIELALVLLTLWGTLGILNAREELSVVGHIGDPGAASCLAVYGDSLWVGTHGAGMIRWSDSESVAVSQGLPGLHVNDCVLHQGSLWVATDSGLAVTTSPDKGFQTFRTGRYLSLSSGSRFLIAVDDQGYGQKIQVNGAIDSASIVERVELELVPSALAVGAGGRWSVGDLNGVLRMVFSDNSGDPQVKSLRVAEPIIGLQYDGVLLRVQVPGGGYRVEDGSITPDSELSSENIALSPDGRVVQFPELNERAVQDNIQWQGRHYVATDDGVFEVEQARLKRLALGGFPCGERIVSVASFNGELWVGSFDRGLCRLGADGWELFQAPAKLPSDRVNDIVATTKHLYVATDLGLVVIDRKGRFVQRTVDQCTKDLSRKCPWHASVNGVAVDPNGKIAWMADVAAVHKMRGRRWKRFYRNGGLASQKLTRIAAHEGVVAVGTSDQGVYLKEGRGKFRRFDDQNGLVDNWVMDLSFDSDGRLWVATCTKGVSVWEKGRWRSFLQKDGLADDYALAVREIEGRMWIGTLSGLTVLSDGGPITLNTMSGLSGNEVHDFVVHKGVVYVATDAGLTLVRVESKS